MNTPRVAIVDDDASVRTALGRLLRLAHYTVATFASGNALVASLANQPVDCVLLDVHMPTLTGFEVAARLRDAHIAVPIIFITASDDRALDAEAARAGSVRLLRKPFSNEALIEAVEAALHGAPPTEPAEPR